MVAHSNTFHITIASVGESRFDSEVVSVTLPGAAGEFTILPQHEPLVTTLKKGIITVRTSKEDSQQFEVEGGVVECSGNRAVVLL